MCTAYSRSAMASLTLFLSGAAMASVISVPIPNIPPLLIEPLPIKVGLCVTPALQGAHLRESRHTARLETGDGAASPGPDWQLGDATVATLTTVARATFAEVVVLDGCMRNPAPPGNVMAVLAAELTSADVPLSLTASGGGSFFTHARVVLHMTLRSTQSPAAVSWDISGIGPIRIGILGKLREEDTARALSEALRDACARFIADLYVNAEVQPWLTDLTAANRVPR